MKTESHELAAIVFTDIVGFTASMEKDEAITMDVLRQFRKKIHSSIEKHDGELLKEIGDGTLLKFKSALNAVLCSIDLQNQSKEINDLKLRIGIHLGDVIIDGGDVFGSGVNIASRIESLAGPGEIFMSSEIHSQIKNKKEIKAESTGLKSIKGIDAKMEVFKVLTDTEIEEEDKVEAPKTLFQDLMNRRVPHILGFYFAASWGILQFIDWAVNRYILSPHLVDFTLTSILSLIPSILILAYFHGAPGKDGWNNIEKIGIPVNVLGSLLILFMFFSAEDLGAATEIVYVENEYGEKIERIIPKSNFRKNLALFFFKNNIVDPKLDWLGQGLTQAINIDLCQDMFINSHASVWEKLYEKGFYDKNSVPLTIKREISKEIHVEYFIGGEISINESGNYVVMTNLHRTSDGKVLAKNTFENSDIFSLIDEISLQIKYDLDIPANHIDNSIDLPISEIMTESLNAYEYYIRGLFNFMGKDFNEGISFMEKAVMEDETFGMAYFHLQGLYVMNNQGDKRLEIAKKAMEYIYKIPERFAYLVKIVFFESNGEMDKVYQVMKMHLDLYPNDIDARSINARLYMANADYESVVNEYKIMLEIDPSRHELLIQIGEFYEGPLDDNEKALENYEKYLSIYPEDADIHFLIGEIHRDCKEFDKAKEYLDKVLVLDPDNIDAFISIIEIDYEDKEKIEKMYDAFGMCKTAKDSVNLYQRIEGELQQHGMISELMENFEIYRKLYPSFATFFEYAFQQLMYPHNYVKINQSDKAFDLVKEYENTYQMPFKLLIDMSYLDIYLALEDGKNAAVHLEKAIEGITAIGAKGILDHIRHLEGKVYRLNGEYDKAIKTLVESNTADHDNHKVELAICYRLQKKHKDALKILNSMTRRKALYELGVLHGEMGKVNEALDYMNEFLDEFKYADPELKKIRKAKEFIKNWKSQS